MEMLWQTWEELEKNLGIRYRETGAKRQKELNLPAKRTGQIDSASRFKIIVPPELKEKARKRNVKQGSSHSTINNASFTSVVSKSQHDNQNSNFLSDALTESAGDTHTSAVFWPQNDLNLDLENSHELLVPKPLVTTDIQTISDNVTHGIETGRPRIQQTTEVPNTSIQSTLSKGAAKRKSSETAESSFLHTKLFIEDCYCTLGLKQQEKHSWEDSEVKIKYVCNRYSHVSYIVFSTLK